VATSFAGVAWLQLPARAAPPRPCADGWALRAAAPSKGALLPGRDTLSARAIAAQRSRASPWPAVCSRPCSTPKPLLGWRDGLLAPGTEPQPCSTLEKLFVEQWLGANRRADQCQVLACCGDWPKSAPLTLACCRSCLATRQPGAGLRNQLQCPSTLERVGSSGTDPALRKGRRAHLPPGRGDRSKPLLLDRTPRTRELRQLGWLAAGRHPGGSKAADALPPPRPGPACGR